MSRTATTTRLHRFIQTLTGASIEYDLSHYRARLAAIETHSAFFSTAADEALARHAADLAHQARDGAGSDRLMGPLFALVREAIRRRLALEPFTVQLLGAMALHDGRIVEMATGEGKTLMALFPACLEALKGRGVHILTVNDYLARRDAAWMGPVYAALGLSVAAIGQGMDDEARRAAYGAEVTYVTAKEAGYDFLRDGLRDFRLTPVQRTFNCAIVDEADSIMVDEARIPLVIAGSADHDTLDLYGIARAVDGLAPGRDVSFDEYARNVFLTDDGTCRIEKLLGCENLYGEGNGNLLGRVNSALHARFLIHAGVDYIVSDGVIELVDEFTGRVAENRRWPDGLQAALEAREGLAVRPGGSILNSITLQNLLRLYPKLAGMTATACAAEEELRHFYGRGVTVIPPNRPCIRIDLDDVIYATKAEKRVALVNAIEAAQGISRPVLVGTASVRESEELAGDLAARGVDVQVLNAHHDEAEARIVARAGMLGTVTIATNMAGRGTDIVLGGADGADRDAVTALGGLLVIGTNRHESRRIDNQLRGRAGRQGDPGSSRFIISLEDDLFTRYGLRGLLASRFERLTAHGVISDPVVTREIDRIQRIIEGQNLEIRKTLCRYSSLVEKQRHIMAHRRREYTLDTGEAPARLAAHDECWSRYLAEIADIRETISLVRYGGRDPLIEFHRQAIARFAVIEDDIAVETRRRSEAVGDPAACGGWNGDPSSTWTYCINDNPFERSFWSQMLGSTGFEAWAGLLWPLTMLNLLVRRIRGRSHEG